jgi:[pyruvate, water dikinase]-phosphate phosphotransferase / [pyruvate, water dikinase] kinase
MIRSTFYVSDSTAMTAKGLGKSLLSQFERVSFVEYLRPYIDTEQKILDLVVELKNAHQMDGQPPIVFASMMDDTLMHLLLSQVPGVIDIFQPFVSTLEAMMEEKTSKVVGRAHNAHDVHAYKRRIEAIDFTLATDDGLKTADYGQADIILLGVSRTGKTPTALYLSLNFGLKVANYPFTAEDLPRFSLNQAQKENRHKLMGLFIGPERLLNIRKERRAQGKYSDRMQIALELDALTDLFLREDIPYIDTTVRSVEEIAASIMSIHSSRR